MTVRFVKPITGIVIALAMTLTGGSAATAHSDDGAIELLEVSPIAPRSLRIEARITFLGDGHAAPDASATVVAVQPDGTQAGPIPLIATSRPGVYAAEITLPEAGDWTLRVSSLSPVAVVEVAQTVAPPTTAATTMVTTTSAAPSPPTGPSGTESPRSTIGAAAPTPEPTMSPSAVASASREGRGPTTVLFVGLLIALVAIALVVARSSRRASAWNDAP